jgi:arylsulfatase A-like enzyme
MYAPASEGRSRSRLTRLFLATAALLSWSLGTGAPVVAGPRPNIVVILTDDQPALDGRLLNAMPTARRIFSEQGLTFSSFGSESPLCCPARAGCLTGQHTHNHGVTWNESALFDPSESLATELQAVGYHTILVGKYFNKYGLCARSHLPHHENCAPNVPPGWDSFHAFGDPAYYGYTLWDDGVPSAYGDTPADYSTDVVRDRAVAAITSAPAEKPLFAWIAPYATHAPTTPAPRYAKSMICAGPAMQWAPPNYNELEVSDKPPYVQAAPLATRPATRSCGRAGRCWPSTISWLPSRTRSPTRVAWTTPRSSTSAITG